MPSAEIVTFFFFAIPLLITSLGVIVARSPVYAAMNLVAAFFFLAGIYVLLVAHLIAFMQILVYAGGILVLYLFVIMLVPLEPEGGRPPVRRARNIAWSLLVAILLGGALMTYFRGAQPTGTMLAGGDVDALLAHGGNIEAMGMEIYQRYLLPFEIASILLLVAMIGAVVLARRQV